MYSSILISTAYLASQGLVVVPSPSHPIPWPSLFSSSSSRGNGRPWESAVSGRRGRSGKRLCSLEAILQHPQVPLPLTGNQHENRIQGNNEVDELISVIRDELQSFPIKGGGIAQALMVVDLIRRLGIQRHFKQHIPKILQWAYMEWNEEYGMADQENTVLAFRLLRHNGYHVSAGVLEKLRDENGMFPSFSIDTPSNIFMVLNLYRCSELGFPSESKIMREIKEFAGPKLRQAISGEHPALLGVHHLSDEIKFALQMPRPCLLPRLESRYLVLKQTPANQTTKKYLSLANLDLTNLQNLHLKELSEIERWWMEQEFANVKAARKRYLIVFFAVSSLAFEPEFSAHRLAFVKVTCLVIVVDDLFDNNIFNIKDLRRFTDAVRKWDASLVDDLPQFKLVMESIISTMSDIARESNIIQGTETITLFRDLWVNFVTSFLTEAEWVHNGEIPTLEEYLKIGHCSTGGALATCASIFLLGERLTGEMLDHIGNHSRFMYLVGLIPRLLNDAVGIEREAKEGKVGTAVNCYMRDNPESTIDDAVKAILRLVESACEELEWEIFQALAVVPECCVRASLNFARAGYFFYCNSDGFTGYDEDKARIVQDYLFNSLPSNT